MMPPRSPFARCAAALFALAAPLLLGGCLAKTAFDVATAPVRMAGKAVDLATTSQSEADEARGREIRRREARLAKLQDDYDKLLVDCNDGYQRACTDAIVVRQEIQDLIPQIPVEPEHD